MHESGTGSGVRTVQGTQSHMASLPECAMRRQDAQLAVFMAL